MGEYDLQTNILQEAQDFYEAFKRCIEGKNPHIDENGRHTSDVVNIPAIVNGAFACELFLNCLCSHYVKSHSLLEIYSYIDKDIRDQIEQQTINQIHTIFQYKDATFEDALKDIDNAFVEWRYIFNEKHTDCFYGNRINRYVPLLSLLISTLSIIALKFYKRKSKKHSNKVIFYVQHLRHLINREKKEMLSEDLIKFFVYKSLVPNDNCEKEILYRSMLDKENLPKEITNISRLDLKCDSIAIEFKYHSKLNTSSTSTTSNYNGVVNDIVRLSHLAKAGFDCYLVYVCDSEMKQYIAKKEARGPNDNKLKEMVAKSFTLSSDLFLTIVRINDDAMNKCMKIVY